jgi:hypothetical protein
MTGNTYITSVAGQLTEIRASQTSAGAGSAGDIVALNSLGLIDDTMLPTVDNVTLVTSVNLAAGDLVNIYSNTGTPTAQHADASLALRANGYVKTASTSPATNVVYFDGILTTTGITPGTEYYLGNSGQVTSTPPSTAGYLSQDIGVGLSTTTINFIANSPITLA